MPFGVKLDARGIAPAEALETSDERIGGSRKNDGKRTANPGGSSL